MGAEWRTEAAYARLIGAAAGAMGADELRMRIHVTGLTDEDAAALKDVSVVERTPDGLVFDVPRYRAFTDLARRIARAGGLITEIAGNDEILLTLLAEGSAEGVEVAVPGARILGRVDRPGFAEDRLLVITEVDALAPVIMWLEAADARLEHVYDH